MVSTYSTVTKNKCRPRCINSCEYNISLFIIHGLFDFNSDQCMHEGDVWNVLGWYLQSLEPSSHELVQRCINLMQEYESFIG